MKVTVHFVDGENLDGEAEQVSLDRGGFSLVGTAGNTRSAWVGAGAIKYIVIHAAFDETYGETDPRAGTNLTKVVLHFLDGEIQHSYRDTVYTEQAGGFVLRLFDTQTRQLLKALVPGSSLKGVFVVDEWDSRTDDEKETRSGPRRRPAPREHRPAPVPDVADDVPAEAVAEPEPAAVAESDPSQTRAAPARPEAARGAGRLETPGRDRGPVPPFQEPEPVTEPEPEPVEEAGFFASTGPITIPKSAAWASSPA